MNHDTILSSGIITQGGLHPLLQSGVPPRPRQQVAPVEYAMRDVRWLHDNKPTVAFLNSWAFAEAPWNEKWSNRSTGIDPRRDSFAMVDELVGQNDGRTFVYSATAETEEGTAVIGVGISVLLNKRGVDPLYNPYHVCQFGAVEGAYYLALVAVFPGFRGEGIFARLAAERLQLGRELGVRQMFMQTHQDQWTVRRRYERNGFRTVGNLEVLSCSGPNGEMAPSKRVMMIREC